MTPTHRTKEDTLMGSTPCWTLPRGTEGRYNPATLTLRLAKPIEGVLPYPIESVHIEAHRLERIPTGEAT